MLARILFINCTSVHCFDEQLSVLEPSLIVRLMKPRALRTILHLQERTHKKLWTKSNSLPSHCSNYLPQFFLYFSALCVYDLYKSLQQYRNVDHMVREDSENTASRLLSIVSLKYHAFYLDFFVLLYPRFNVFFSGNCLVLDVCGARNIPLLYAALSNIRGHLNSSFQRSLRNSNPLSSNCKYPVFTMS